MKTRPQRTEGMEAPVFNGRISDHLQPHAAALKVAHPPMLRAIAAAKKKNDRIDASKTFASQLMLCVPLTKHPFADVWRTVRYFCPRVVAGIQKANNFYIQERHPW